MDLNTEFFKFNCIFLNFFQTCSTEILEYSSDSENKDDSKSILCIDSESSHKFHMDFGSDGRQVVERSINPRVKSMESILYTPQRQTKYPRTAENSAKKKKLLRLCYTFLNNSFKKVFLFLWNVNLKMLTHLLGKENWENRIIISASNYGSPSSGDNLWNCSSKLNIHCFCHNQLTWLLPLWRLTVWVYQILLSISISGAVLHN